MVRITSQMDEHAKHTDTLSGSNGRGAQNQAPSSSLWFRRSSKQLLLRQFLFVLSQEHLDKLAAPRVIHHKAWAGWLFAREGGDWCVCLCTDGFMIRLDHIGSFHNAVYMIAEAFRCSGDVSFHHFSSVNYIWFVCQLGHAT